LLRDAIQVIGREHASPDPSVAYVAREIATSRRQLQRSFRELSDGTFVERVRRIRFERAERFLRLAPGVSVQQIASHVGYRQPAQFAKTFRKRNTTTLAAAPDQQRPSP